MHHFIRYLYYSHNTFTMCRIQNLTHIMFKAFWYYTNYLGVSTASNKNENIDP